MVSKYDRAIEQLMKLLLHLDFEWWCSQMLKFEIARNDFLLIIKSIHLPVFVTLHSFFLKTDPQIV